MDTTRVFEEESGTESDKSQGWPTCILSGSTLWLHDVDIWLHYRIKDCVVTQGRGFKFVDPQRISKPSHFIT